MKKDLGPKFVQYMEPVVAALRALGGSARAPEVVDKVAELLQVNDEKRAEQTSNGNSRFDNMVAWARFFWRRLAILIHRSEVYGL